MREPTKKPLPLQMLRLFLSRATDAALDAGDQSRGRALATTLEKHALQLRLKFGGNTPLQSRNTDVKQTTPKKPAAYKATCTGCGKGYESAIKTRLERTLSPCCTKKLTLET